MANLVSQFSCVAENEGINLVLDGHQLLKNGQDEDGSLTHTRFGLADDVHTQNGLRDAFLLHCKISSRISQMCAKRVRWSDRLMLICVESTSFFVLCVVKGLGRVETNTKTL